MRLIAFLLFLVSGNALAEQRIDFDVFLDESKIGSHEYVINGSADNLSVRSTAQFKVKFLFVTAFDYRHEARETWSSGCLTSIQSATRANGKKESVSGQAGVERFVVSNGGQEQHLTDCVMSFAYWNPDILKEGQLLNSQTGDYETVEVVDLGSDTVDYNGQALAARKYELRLPKTSITVWYGADCARWLALESPAKGGRVIRYEPAELPVSVGFAMDKFEGIAGSES